MIEGVSLIPLKVIPDERGVVMHMLRCNSPLFKNFGEIYFSKINPGIIKGWKKHLRMTQNIAVPVGKIMVVIYDDRESSSTKGRFLELEIGQDNYQLVSIPPQVWYAFKCLSNVPALITNCTDLPHDPQEATTLDIFDKKIPYSWK